MVKIRIYNMSYNVLDLFCGAGGFSQGLKRSNKDIDKIYAVDNKDYCLDTINKNHNNINTYNEDLSDIDAKEFSEKYNINKDNIDIVVGGPPCQGFSKGSCKRNESDERNKLVYKFVNFVNYYKPKYFMMENVKRLLTFKDGEYINNILDKLDNKYNINYKNIECYKFGVPQNRERVFILGKLGKKPVEFPEYTHKNEKDYKTVEESIGDLPELKSGEKSNIDNHIATDHSNKIIDKIENTEQGNSIYDNFGQGRKLKPNDISYTITTGSSNAHYDQNRILTNRERARLQSFRDNYILNSVKTKNENLIGNAVPPLVIQKIFDDINNK